MKLLQGQSVGFTACCLCCPGLAILEVVGCRRYMGGSQIRDTVSGIPDIIWEYRGMMGNFGAKV